MERFLYLLHHENDGSFADRALEGLAFAKALAAQVGGDLRVAVCGEQATKAAQNLAGASQQPILVVEGAEFAFSRFATDATALTAICETAAPTVVLACSTTRMTRVLAAVACRCKGAIDTHITGASVNGGQLSVQRWYYRQRIQAEQCRSKRPWFMLFEGGMAPAWQIQTGTVQIQKVECRLPADKIRTIVEGKRTPIGESQTIRPAANLLFVAGAGWTKKQSDGQTHPDQAASLIRTFLQLGDASLGSTKSLVDLKGEGQTVLPFLTHLNQVGQTGSTPRHPKGLATCCHGEEPHVVGWRFINERRAINLDANCGWAQGKADVLYVADAFAVLEEINKLLQE